MPAAAEAPAEAGPAQVFQATGQGEGKTAADGAGTAATATATATVLSSPVLLINAGTGTLEWDAVGDRPWLSVSPGNGTLTSGSLAGLTSVVDASALSPGTHTGKLTVSDPAGVNTPAQVNVTVGVAQAQELVLDTPLTGLAGPYGTEAYYAVSVPAGTATLSIGTSGGTGDVDLFVRYGEAPSTSRFDCQSWSAGTAESCVLPSPRAGTYYVMVRGWSTYSGVTLHAAGGGPPAAPSGVVLRPLTTASLRLTWADSVANETGFTVSRRSEPSPGTWTAWADAGTTAANAVRFNHMASAGVNYQYRVRACNAAGCSAWVASAPARIPTSLPSAPFGLSAVAAGANRAALTWTDGSVDEASFSVARSLRGGDGSWGPFEAAGSAPAGVTSFTSTGLLAGGTYRFQVNACNVVGCSGWAASGPVVLPTVPAAPTGLTGTVVSGTSIRLSWMDASSNEASFQLTRALVSSTGTVGEFVEVATLPPNRTTFTSTGLVPGTTYRFRVRACNLAGCAARATSPGVSIPPVPGTPMALTASPSSGAIRLTWTDGPGETSYLLSRSLRNPDGTWGAWSPPVSHPANTARVDDTGLLAGRVYGYQLRACNVSGCSQKATAVAATPAS
ncbi:fibronectin type III domain-containing protein [Longimicrobium sp.]|uniref:fibronectin type III domain-containing protein n=1 Tax=Longimicrobium sp. TaxID=2029185 RepID=UPI002ED7963D